VCFGTKDKLQVDALKLWKKATAFDLFDWSSYGSDAFSHFIIVEITDEQVTW